MKFSEREIEIAKKLHDLKIQWQSQAGQYVFDIMAIIEKRSPFQKGVYFILNIKHFLRRAGSIENIRAAMCLLPLSEDCRDILKCLDIPWNTVENRLNEISAFEKRQVEISLV